jgi:hypothetical protein
MIQDASAPVNGEANIRKDHWQVEQRSLCVVRREAFVANHLRLNDGKEAVNRSGPETVYPCGPA